MKKNNGFAIWTVAASVLIFFGAISFSACQNELLDSPSFQNRGSYSTGRVAAPTNLTATQGGFRSITIKWTAAKSAVFYNIYHSDTATGNFTFLEQTPDATCSYTTSADPDVKKYYKIQSVDTNGEVSEQYSQICFGTTLATPIITSIKQNAKGDAITVRWYKGVNCTTDTYLNDSLNYTIVLYNADGTQVLREETISAMDVKEAADTKYTFTNLTPNTKYKIQIKAYTKSAQDSKSTESSDKEDQSTAHSLIPAAPENFSVSKGTSKDSVTLSWELPKYAEIKSATAFETRPVYFKIYRKLESAPENAYEPIVTYLGTKAPTITEDDSTKLEKTAIQFTKPAEEASATNDNIKVGESLAVSKTDSEGNEIKIIEVTYPSEVKETDPNYPDYIPGTKITLNDLTVSRGQKYSYRVQSFIDDNGKKNVTSDESYSEETGWLINSPTVSVSSTYQENKDDENKIDSFTVTLNFKFDDFDQPYNYVITETRQKMRKATDAEIAAGEQDKPEGDPIIRKPNSTSYTNFFPWKDTYTPPKEENTYLLYTYEVAVCQKDSKNDDSNKYIKVSAPGSVIVINDKSMIPDVSSFNVKDGYKDKFELSWIYDKNCKYILTWKNTDKNGTETQGEYEFQESDFIKDGKQIENKKEFTYEHKAESGDIRTEYTLNADNGLKNHETAKDENENMEFKTLGTPEPYFEPSYDSIKVIWNAVQKADGTKYAAEYTFNNEKTTIPSENIKTDDDGKTFWCEIRKPYGETTEETPADRATDASVSGSDIDFVLTADSNVDKCDTKIPVSTLGPANLDLKITGDRKTITLTWNKVKGAKGYLVFRKKYIKDYFDSEDDKGDLYYCSDENNQENLSVTLIGADAEPSASCVSNTPGTLKFTDKYQPVTESYYQDQYRTAQAQLAWGLPYGYTVIPVKDSSDFEFDEAYEIKGTSNSIAYTEDSLKKVEKKGATFGYGLAIEASKATTNDEVKIKWKQPYGTTSKPTLFYRNYNAENGSTWNQGTTVSSEESSASIKPKVLHKAYDYMIYYNIDGIPEIDPYYEYFLSSDSQLDSDKEKANKGYIFSFATPTAEYAGQDGVKNSNYYSEKFTWQTFGEEGFNIYDSTERKKKPDSIKIFMLNTNKAVGWQEIAEINPTTLKATAITENCIKYDLDVDTTDAYSITVAPDGIKNKGATNTNGLLKVLRDAKHYYKIEGERKDGDTSIYATVGDNTKVDDKDLIYAYRQITDEELVKATMLVIADAFNITPKGNTTNGAEGSFWWNGEYVRWSVPIRYALKMKINNYLYSWKNLPNQQLSVTPINNFIKITDLNESNEARGKASDGKPLFMCLKEDDNFSISKLIPLTIENTHIPLSSYSGTVNFATSDTQFSVTVEHNGSQTFKQDVSGDEVKKWFPAKIGNNAYIGDTAEYWWE